MKRKILLTLLRIIAVAFLSVQGAIAQCECDLVPEASVILKGGPIEFEAIVTNNTDLTDTVSFVTFLTPPLPYVRYPSSGWLDGPYELLMTPYGSKFGRISHTVPINWPVGTYTYHGWVGRPGPVVDHECQFEFEVIEGGSPPEPPVIDSISPIAGSCGAIVILRGRFFGPSHTAERSVLMAGPIPATLPQVAVPIRAWTDTLIEILIPCWTFAPGDYYVVVQTEKGLSNLTVFTITGSPTVLGVIPTQGQCTYYPAIDRVGLILNLMGTGIFGSQRKVAPSSTDGYHGLERVVDFVSSSGSYTATFYGDAAPYPWTDSSIHVLFGEVFEDQVDPNTGIRNFSQDDGLSLCPSEPTIPGCVALTIGEYQIYVKAVYYGDNDASDDLSCGDTVFQVEKSDPAVFSLSYEPPVYKVVPSQIERSYFCDHDANPSTPDILINNIVTLYGANFGSHNIGDVVKIGLAGWHPLTQGIVLPRVVQWEPTVIRVGIDKPYVPDAAVGLNNVVIWVVKAGEATQQRPIKILPDSCP